MTDSAWKVFKYGVFSGPYFPVEKPDKKKLCIWTLISQCDFKNFKTLSDFSTLFFTWLFHHRRIHRIAFIFLAFIKII